MQKSVQHLLIINLPTKNIERNERTYFSLPLLQRYSTLLLMLNRSAMFTKKKRLLSFCPCAYHMSRTEQFPCMVPSKYTEIMSSQTNQDFFHNLICTTSETTTLSHDHILCMPCCCEVLGKGIEMSETINFHSEVHRQHKVRDVGPNCLCEWPGRQLKQRF